MRRIAWLTSVSLLLSGLAVALAPFADARAQDDDSAADGAPTPHPALVPGEPALARELTDEDRARRAKVVARVGEETITLGDVEDTIQQQSPFVRVRYRDPAQLRDHVRSMVRFELLARAAERAGFDEHEEVVHTAKQNAVQLLIRRDFDEEITVESIPQADVVEYFETHPEEFSRPELRRAAHIRVDTREEALRLLEEAREADARAFRALAREHSTDPATKLRGGDLRYFDEGGRPRNTRDGPIDEGLAAAAFAIEEVGGVADEPVQVGDAWSVVKLTGRRPAESRTVAQSGPTIRLRLWRSRRQQALEDFVARLRREAGVEANYDRLRPIRLDPPEREDQPAGHGDQPAGHGASAEEAPAGEAPPGDTPATE